MTCRDIDGLIMAYASGAAVSPEATAHIAGCDRCQRLAQAIGQPPRVTVPSPEQLKRIEAGILADMKPVKPLVPAGVLWFGLLFMAAVVVAIGSVALGIAGWLALGPLQRIAVFTTLAGAACLLAFSAGRQIVPGTRLLPSPNWLVAALLGAMTGLFAFLFHPRQEATFVSTGLECLRIGLACAVPAALTFWLLLRRGAILNPMLTGATAGALAGLTGLTVLEIFCPNLNVYHILVWHLGAALTSAAGGMAIGAVAEHSGWRHTPRTP